MEGAQFSLRVGPLDGDPFPCELERLDAQCARVRLRGAVPTLAPTAESALWWTPPHSGASVVLPAISGWPERDGDDVVCDLYFADPQVLDALHGAHPDHVVADRRSSPRVAPDASEHIEVYLQAESSRRAPPARARLVDVGSGGLRVELGLERELSPPMTLAVVQLLLPGESWPLILAARLRYRRRCSKAFVQYGLEFTRSGSRDFEAQIEQIAQWVGTRQRELAASIPPLAQTA